MDIPLFALCLLTFASLYLGLTVFLFWAIAITVLIVMIYLAVRWRSVSENYPEGLGDSLTLLVLVAVTWALFILIGPHPVPFLGQGLTYGVDPPWDSIATIVIIFIFVVLILFSILIPYLQGRANIGSGGGGGDGGGGGKRLQGVGA